MNLSNFNLCFYKDGLEIYNGTYQNQSHIENQIEFDFLDYHTWIDLNVETLTRENGDFIFFLDFKNKSCTISLKKEQMDLNVLVDECSFKTTHNKIILDYTIETEDAKNRIVITEGNDL